MGRQQQLRLFYEPNGRTASLSLEVAPFRAACEHSIASGQFAGWRSLAIACGYKWDGRGDSRRLKLMLGVTSAAPSQNRSKQASIHRSSALRIINALGKDPVDFGL